MCRLNLALWTHQLVSLNCLSAGFKRVRMAVVLPSRDPPWRPPSRVQGRLERRLNTIPREVCDRSVPVNRPVRGRESGNHACPSAVCSAATDDVVARLERPNWFPALSRKRLRDQRIDSLLQGQKSQSA
jgi:hypothetical protein